MGLDTTHDCWHGAYSDFNLWRFALALAAGIDMSAMHGFGGETAWEDLPADPLHVLLNHSDCDGIIEWKHARALAARLEELQPKLLDEYYQRRSLFFIKGLRQAAALQEDVEFH